MCPNIPLYIINFLTNILLSENKYTNNDMMLEWKKQFWSNRKNANDFV